MTWHDLGWQDLVVGTLGAVLTWLAGLLTKLRGGSK